MEGLSEGSNFVWGIKTTKEIKILFQIDLIYDGRSSKMFYLTCQTCWKYWCYCFFLI